MDRIDAQANELLRQKFGENWNEITYADIRKDLNACGFTSEYLFRSANYKGFSSSAEIQTLLKLAKLDLQKGTTIPQLVFSCCRWFPKREAIQSLIQIRENDTEEEVFKSVLEFQDHQGGNCLIYLFQMANGFRIENNFKYPSGPMLHDIEESCLFLIEKAKDLELDLDKILNHTTKDGNTLFFQASSSSERMTKYLLTEKDVRVNSIDHKFVTPFFRVRLKVDF